jgi:hypothetical protein
MQNYADRDKIEQSSRTSIQNTKKGRFSGTRLLACRKTLGGQG